MISVAGLVALVIALGCLAHTVWFVRQSKRWGADMNQVLAELRKECTNALEENAQLRAELAEYTEEIARLRTELAKCGHREHGVPE